MNNWVLNCLEICFLFKSTFFFFQWKSNKIKTYLDKLLLLTTVTETKGVMQPKMVLLGLTQQVQVAAIALNSLVPNHGEIQLFLESSSENLCKMLNGELTESQLIRNRRQKDLCGI